MLEKDTLRKADIFSGAIVFLFGLFVAYQALQMPMKDTYGGVQNVWYVSPAIFPLFIGAVITLLGLALTCIALKSAGLRQLAAVFRYLTSPELIAFLRYPATIRFYAIVLVFFSFVFIMIPRIDFFLAAVFFLMVFISMFYLDDDRLLLRILYFFIGANFLLIIFFTAGLDGQFTALSAYPGDWLVLLCIAAFVAHAWTMVRGREDLRKRYRTGLILSVAAPFIVGIVFKFLLLVPMPFEGMVIELLDTIWYASW